MDNYCPPTGVCARVRHVGTGSRVHWYTMGKQSAPSLPGCARVCGTLALALVVGYTGTPW